MPNGFISEIRLDARGLQEIRSRVPALKAIALVLLTVSCRSTPALGQQPPGAHVPQAVRTLKSLGRLDANKFLDLGLGMAFRSGTNIDETLRGLYDPADPSFRHFLSPQQFDLRFAPTQDSINRLEAFARSNGLQVLSTPGNMVVHVRGTATNIEKAFRLELNLYQHPTENRTFYSPASEPVIPSDVPISHITGLDNFVLPRPAVTPCKGAAELTQPPASAYFGKSFRKAYAPDVPVTGTGEVIGILALNGYFANDIEAYEVAAGMAQVPLKNVFIDGFNGSVSGDNCEVSLDIENAISMAPGITQLTVYAASNDLAALDLLGEMASPTQGEPLPNQLSTSYFFFYDKNIYAALKRIAAQGQVLFSCSGDTGAFTTYPGNTPFPPADFPWIVSVGGTVLTVNASGNWVSEAAWSSSSGGVSPWQSGDANFDLPSYQQGISNTQNRASTVARNVPDVAMVAQNVAVRSGNGIWSVTGGTSSAAPLWAGFMALANQEAASKGLATLGFVDPAIYSIGKGSGYLAAFHDIATGNNSISSDPKQFAAVSGYDLVTGWGTPRGQATINALMNKAVSCPDLKKEITALQNQLAAEQAERTKPICAGPASFDCLQVIKQTQQMLQGEMRLYDNFCQSPN
jgi:subtilase family serine protease